MATPPHATPPAPTAAAWFGAMAESYDSLIRRALPQYDEMTDRLLDYLPLAPAAALPAPRIFDLGCGTGNLTLRLAEKFPGARITAVDASPEMVSITRERLAERSPDVAKAARFIEARFEDLDLAPASFDIVTSCLSLHHVADKAPLYQRIRRWVAPGGTFRFADQFAGATDPIHRFNWNGWIESAGRPGGSTPEELRELVNHSHTQDHYTPLHEQFRMLTEAGFNPRALDCVWRDQMWGVVVADV